MPVDPMILLPPSEGKTPGGTGRWKPGAGRFAALGPTRAGVAAALATAMADPALARKLTGLSGERADRAVDANRRVLAGPTLPARRRYSGVVWEHLGPAAISGAARRRASQIVVVSALGGAFGFDEPVPDYKLKMGASLPGIGSLAALWRPVLAAALAEAAAGAPVWDLLPAEHRRAIDVDAFDKLTVVDFRAAGGQGAAGHAAKAAKGRFTRWLLEAGADPLDAADRFSWDGWTGRVEHAGLVVVTAGGTHGGRR